MKLIVAGVLTGWTGIVALAWWLADRRLGSMCKFMEQYCNASQLATRDWTLVAGIALPFLLISWLALTGRIRIARLNLRWPTRTPASSRAVTPLERSED